MYPPRSTRKTRAHDFSSGELQATVNGHPTRPENIYFKMENAARGIRKRTDSGMCASYNIIYRRSRPVIINVPRKNIKIRIYYYYVVETLVHTNTHTNRSALPSSKLR